MTTKPLPYEEPRCHDSVCQVRHDCLRWMERKDRAIRHYAIMRPTYHCNDAPCDHYIKSSEVNQDCNQG